MIGRIFRLLLGFFGPAALTVLIVDLVMTNPEGIWTPLPFIASYLRLLGFVYPLVAVQAVIYTLVMEFCVNYFVSRPALVGVISAFLCTVAASALTREVLLPAMVSGWMIGFMLSMLYQYGYLTAFGPSQDKEDDNN